MLPLDTINEKVDGLKLSILAYRGSHAHGLYVPPEDPMSTDDIDLMGLVLGGPEHYFGLKEWGSKGTKDFWVNEYDIVIYEFRKLIGLLCKANPNVLSLLWLEPEDYLVLDPLGELLIEHRDLFLTKFIYHSFTGYANAQLKKMTSGSYEGYMGTKRKAKKEKNHNILSQKNIANDDDEGPAIPKCPKCNKEYREDETVEPHTCPYAEEINDDHDTMCWCCDDCTYECAMDI